MRQTEIFAGSSHPVLVEGICDRLGQKPGNVELRKFSNGETSVQIQETSIRDQDVFIVQSGSSKINDNVMELLIMISACKGGSARSITAVMPYFPYSRQSKKKSHRGAITARMIANLLHVAGVDHVITIDLHASQMQGFFKCPVDNLVAEPLLARWIRVNVPNWKEAVAVSKNPGGTKRVTSLADALKLSFGIVTTDRRRPGCEQGGLSMQGSAIFERMGMDGTYETPGVLEAELDAEAHITPSEPENIPSAEEREKKEQRRRERRRSRALSNPAVRALANGAEAGAKHPSPLAKSSRPDSFSEDTPDSPRTRLMRTVTAPSATHSFEDPLADEFTDERARDIVHGRLVHGHIVDDDFPSPALSAVSGGPAVKHFRLRGGSEDEAPPENMINSFMSAASSVKPEEDQSHALGGTIDAGHTSEEEEEDLKNPELETMVTLVGNVRGRPVCIVDDMIDKSASWIAAAETVVKRGGATKVYCMATHGLFGGECLEEMEECECIDKIVVTNSFPIPEEKKRYCSKLVVLGVENLLAEAIRRNHHGESISQLFMHYD
ncbi:phosphoribosyl pyrophosphokinase [Saccharata proteae CBS 121410]|uniref:Ribose-phosphate pyrophosphokinase 1 n=1 Tax=Saccharata proteae CBS 121410 TaxID=1314787 RepID=A0A6A5YD36_9PEZI|nr:phosphoribosyl pyrophosphokinase [Saccharata proteae CBS 121410]